MTAVVAFNKIFWTLIDMLFVVFDDNLLITSTASSNSVLNFIPL
jgi:hypothetical protein